MTHGERMVETDSSAIFAVAVKQRAQSAVCGAVMCVSEGWVPPPRRWRGQGMVTSAAECVTPGASQMVSPGLFSAGGGGGGGGRRERGMRHEVGDVTELEGYKWEHD